MKRAIVCLAFLSFAACGDDSHTQLKVTLFAAAPDAIEVGQSTKLLFVVEPSDATVTISNIGDVTGQTETSVSPAMTTDFELTATRGGHTATATVTVTVGPAHAAGLRVTPATASTTAGATLSVTVTAVASDGANAPGYRGTVHLTSTDGQAVLPADVEFMAADAGVKTLDVVLKTAGLETISAVDTMAAGTAGSGSVTVTAAAASVFTLDPLPGAAVAGQGLALTITARDAFNNVATTYAGQAQVTSADPTDILPAAGTFSGGVRAVSLAFTTAGSHTATVSEVAGAIPAVDTTAVVISAAAPDRIAVSAASSVATAGVAEGFTAAMVDPYGNPVTTYVGTVHFTSSDGQAIVPIDYTYTAGDAGSHDFAATLGTAGPDTVTVTDTVTAANGSVTWNVAPAAATNCATVQTPASTSAGAPIGITVVVKDDFGNVATTYAGTIGLTATDVRAVLPPNATYVPLIDGGSHVFSASLLTAGAQVVTATDIANPTLHCDALIAVAPGAPGFVLTVPGNANAGYAVAVGLAVRDAFGNPVTTYAGTVTFSSTDSGPGAATPAPITFTGAQGGVASTNATFVTLGGQTLAASDGSATGSANVAVHGLVYTPPASGRVRLVANAVSNTQIVQLDLVANERLEISSFFGGGPGSFAAGMNLPLDTTRVGADAVLFTPGPALPAGSGTRAAAARIGATDHVLYTVVARKRVAGTVFNQSTEVQAGGVFYSVRLKLTQAGTVGAVFDGAQASPLYRAAVRDQWGDDFVNQGDFGVGKLEIR